MYNLKLDKWERLALLVLLSDALDNTKELLHNHDKALGRTTDKNARIANDYEAHIKTIEIFKDKVLKVEEQDDNNY